MSLCLPVFQEFFRNLSHWMDQHSTMNDSGNFLIETCDETVSLDLKQQLLLLNGRWRDLFLKVKQVTKILYIIQNTDLCQMVLDLKSTGQKGFLLVVAWH